MLRAAQALADIVSAFQPGNTMRLIAVVAATAMLGGCASGGFNLSKADVDPSLVTGSTQSASSDKSESEQASDENTIRNAVSAADVSGLGGNPVPWANPETGSRGAISSLVEEKKGETLCRRFTTSRERFDGVAQYKGQVCMIAPGAWQVQGFDSL